MNNRLTPIKVELFKAVDRNDSNMVRKCINQGADVNFQYDNGVTCLMHACQHDLLEIAQLLVTLGADVNIKDNNGNTALMILCLFNKDYEGEGDNEDDDEDKGDDIVEFVQFLLEKGADINIRDKDGDTVLYIVKLYFPDENPNKDKIINILEKWPTTMGILALTANGAGSGIEDSDLFQFMGKPKGGKKRKSKKNNKKSKKNKKKTKKNKRKSKKRNKKSNKSKKRK